jgi:hypothetical protein
MIPQKSINMEALLTESVAQRFWSKVDKSGDCWDWTTGKMKDGYGRFSFCYMTYPAHRIAYALANKVDPGVLLVCHSCDRPICTNPAHLFLGDAVDNQRDKIAKGRQPNLHGERGANADLTNDAARLVRELSASGKYTFESIAKMFNTRQHTIQRIVTGNTYQDAGGPITKDNNRCKKGANNGRAKITEDVVLAARELFDIDGYSIKKIAVALAVNESTMGNAVHRKTWKHI